MTNNLLVMAMMLNTALIAFLFLRVNDCLDTIKRFCDDVELSYEERINDEQN